jgi:hypothetical protein
LPLPWCLFVKMGLISMTVLDKGPKRCKFTLL